MNDVVVVDAVEEVEVPVVVEEVDDVEVDVVVDVVVVLSSQNQTGQSMYDRVSVSHPDKLQGISH